MRSHIPILILVALCVLVFANSLWNEFTYDDAGMMDEELFSNIHDLRSFLSPDYYRFSGEMTFRPLVTLSYFLDFSLWRFNPIGFHLTNMLWHAAAATLVYLVLLRLIGSPASALAGAMVFAVHPVQTEAVNAVGFREDLICTCGYLIAFLLYLRSAGGEGRRAATGYLLSLACFIFALLAKEMAVTFPAVIMLHGLLFTSTGGTRRSLRRTLILATGYAVVVTAYLVLRYTAFYNPMEAATGCVSEMLPERLARIPRLFALYLGLCIRPVGLSVEYEDSVFVPFRSAGGLLSLGVCAGYAAAIAALRRRNPRACFFAAFIPISLIPVLNLVPICNPIAERYLYLPCFGFAGLAAAGFDAMRRRDRGKTAVILACAICAVYSCCTVLRNRVWRDGLSLWSDAVLNAPGSARARLNLGVALGARGMVERAMEEYRESARLRPTSPDALNNMGLIRMGQGRTDEAIALFQRAVGVDPYSVRAHLNLALALARRQEKDAAVQILEKLVALRELNAPLKCALANVYLDLGLRDKAEAEYRRALDIKPYSFEALTGLGKISFQKERLAEAERYFERACGIRGASYARAVSMGNIYFARGLYDKAETEYGKAIALKPNLGEGYNNLGLVYSRRGRFDEAARHFEEALKRDPRNPTILLNAAEAEYGRGNAAQARAHVAEIFEEEKVPERTAGDLARYYWTSERYAEAAELFGMAIIRHPSFGWGYVARARALLLLGRAEDAAACLNSGAPHLTGEHLGVMQRDHVFAPIGLSSDEERSTPSRME